MQYTFFRPPSHSENAKVGRRHGRVGCRRQRDRDDGARLRGLDDACPLGLGLGLGVEVGVEVGVGVGVGVGAGVGSGRA